MRCCASRCREDDPRLARQRRMTRGDPGPAPGRALVGARPRARGLRAPQRARAQRGAGGPADRVGRRRRVGAAVRGARPARAAGAVPAPEHDAGVPRDRRPRSAGGVSERRGDAACDAAPLTTIVRLTPRVCDAILLNANRRTSSAARQEGADRCRVPAVSSREGCAGRGQAQPATSGRRAPFRGRARRVSMAGREERRARRKGGDSNPRDRFPGLTVFKTAAFNRSATLPRRMLRAEGAASAVLARAPRRPCRPGHFPPAAASAVAARADAGSACSSDADGKAGSSSAAITAPDRRDAAGDQAAESRGRR